MRPYRGHFAPIAPLIVAAFVGPAVAAPEPAYRNPKLPVEQRVADLMRRMTLAEKLTQLRGTIGNPENGDGIAKHQWGHIGTFTNALGAKEAAETYNRVQKQMLAKTRLGIPFLFHDEAVVGLKQNGATAFPQPIAEGASFDVDLMGKVARAIAEETRARGVRQVLSPTINVTQDPRWGRTHETYGEDPYLVGALGTAFVQAFEAAGIVTTPKHFVANHGEQGLNFYPTHFGERSLREYHFPPFRRVVVEGHASSLMAAYNSNEGVPCSANAWLLDTVLRKEWGFTGFVVSDYGSISQLVDVHHVAPDLKVAAKLALEAGVDVELPEIQAYGAPLEQAIAEKLVSMTTVGRAVRRVLTAKFRLGLFDDPFVDPQKAVATNDSREHRELARQAAREGIVLLKNDAGTLPLKPSVKRIAVLGPLGNEIRLGNYAPWGTKLVTVYEALRALRPDAQLTLAKGAELEGVAYPAIPAEFLHPPAGQWTGARGLKGEYFDNDKLAGTPKVVRLDPQVDFNWNTGIADPKLPPDHFSARWTGQIVFPETHTYRLGVTRNDGARLWIDGKLLVDKWSVSPAVLEKVDFAAEKGRAYDVRIEYFEDGNNAVVRFGAEMDLERELQKAVTAAKQAQAAVIVVGTLDGEGQDRARLELPALQERLIKQVAATGTPTIVVLQSGNVVAPTSWLADADAVVEAWYPGEEGGTAIAEVLTGATNPGGKLPFTFPRETGQVPGYYNMKPPGGAAGVRGYIDATGGALFPFGYGLSYTTFAYANPRASAKVIRPNDAIEVSIEVTNTGKVAGDEVVQLYVRDVVSSVTRPERELRGFRRVHLAPGETKRVAFSLGRQELGLWSAGMKLVVEPGAFEAQFGASATDIRAVQPFDVR